MATYYVSKTGSDSNDGLTEATAKLTITAMAAAIGSAGSEDGADGRIIVGPGTYTESLIDKLPSGVSGAPFRLISSSPLGAILQNSGVAGIGINTASHYLNIEGIHFKGTGLFASGGSLRTHHHLSVMDCEFSQMPNEIPAQFSGCDDVMFDGNTLHETGSFPYSFPCSSGGYCVGLYVSERCRDFIISDNHVFDVSGYGIQIFAEITLGTGHVVKRNKVHGILAAGGIISYGSNYQFINNIVYDCHDPGIILRAASNIKLYFNTCYGNGNAGGFNAGGITKQDGSGVVAQNNICFSNTGAQISVDTEANNFTSNPLFINAGGGNFHLSEGSPARGAGVFISGITHDFDGREINPNFVDAGALQYGVGAVDPPPDDEDEEEEESPPGSPGGGGGIGGVVEPIDEGVFPELANKIDSFDSVRFEDKIHADTQEVNTGRVSYHIHDMATKLWETVNMTVLASNSDGDTGCSICVRSSGEPVVCFMGDRVTKGPGHLMFDGMKIASAGDYRRAYVSRLDGSWTTPAILATPDDLVGTFYPDGFNYQGYVHVRVGRAIAEADDWVRFVFTVDVPGDVANTPELFTQLLRPDNTLTDTYKVKLALSTWYTSTHVVGQPCVFEYEGTQYTAVPVGFTHHPMLFIWEGTGTLGGATIQIELTDFSTGVQVQPDSFCTLNPPISVHFFDDKLHVVMGTRKAGTTEWAAYKTISPPFTTLDPSALTEPRNDQAGVTWPKDTYSRQGVEFAKISGRTKMFKVATGTTNVPSSTKKSILEKIDIESDIPGDNGYTVAQFLIDNP